MKNRKEIAKGIVKVVAGIALLGVYYSLIPIPIPTGPDGFVESFLDLM